MSLGARLVDFPTALRLVALFLAVPFEGGRHVRRLRLIDSPS
jgi:ribose 5-phosphate isomerase RpiB